MNNVKIIMGILYFVIVVAVLGAIGYGGYYVWDKYIKKWWNKLMKLFGVKSGSDDGDDNDSRSDFDANYLLTAPGTHYLWGYEDISTNKTMLDLSGNQKSSKAFGTNIIGSCCITWITQALDGSYIAIGSNSKVYFTSDPVLPSNKWTLANNNSLASSVYEITLPNVSGGNDHYFALVGAGHDGVYLFKSGSGNTTSDVTALKSNTNTRYAKYSGIRSLVQDPHTGGGIIMVGTDNNIYRYTTSLSDPNRFPIGEKGLPVTNKGNIYSINPFTLPDGKSPDAPKNIVVSDPTNSEGVTVLENRDGYYREYVDVPEKEENLEVGKITIPAHREYNIFRRFLCVGTDHNVHMLKTFTDPLTSKNTISDTVLADCVINLTTSVNIPMP